MPTLPTRWETAGTVAIVLLSIVSSLLGLIREGHYAEPAEVLLHIYAQDVVLLVIGVPVLVVGLVWARRGSIRGRLVWLGALAYMAYMWTHYAFVIASNDFFLGYVALFGFSVFTLLSGVLTTDAARFYTAPGRVAFRGDVSSRVTIRTPITRHHTGSKTRSNVSALRMLVALYEREIDSGSRLHRKARHPPQSNPERSWVNGVLSEHETEYGD